MTTMTSEDARQADCIGPPGTGRISGDRRRCVGHVCLMAWRWAGKTKIGIRECDDESAQTEPPRPGDLPATWVFLPRQGQRRAQWRQPEAEAATAENPDRKGYCGLAGKPED